MLLASPSPVMAQQDYPVKPIRMIVPIVPGGSIDIKFIITFVKT